MTTFIEPPAAGGRSSSSRASDERPSDAGASPAASTSTAEILATLFEGAGSVSAPAVFHDPVRFFYDDRLNAPTCRFTLQCQSSIRSLREIASRARATETRFFCCTPSEFLELPEPALQVGLFAVAALDLDAYADEAAFDEAARCLTAKRGRVTREIARARRRGYYARTFIFADHAEDIAAIHASAPVRDGRPIQGAYYYRSAAQLAAMPEPDVSCPEHHQVRWGVFHRGAAEGREKLVAYVSVTRLGQCAWYNAIMGHSDHLRDGIMHLLHHEIVADALRRRPAGLRYITYQTFLRRPGDRSSWWKYLALFKPVYFHYVGDRALQLPVEPPMPDFGRGLMVLKQTVALPLARAQELASLLGVDPGWLSALHQVWVREAAREATLGLTFLRAAPYPPLDMLRPLASHVFPAAALAGVSRAVVVLSGACRGLDTLLPLHDAGVTAQVFHQDPEQLRALAATYPEHWSYTPWRGEIPASRQEPPDLAVIDAAIMGGWTLQRLFAGGPSRAVVAADARLFAALGCSNESPLDVIAQQASAAAGVQLACKGRFFRHGHPDPQFWLWLERTEGIAARLQAAN